MTQFIIKPVLNEDTGALLESVVKVTPGQDDEVWCSIQDLDALFATCVARWGGNWDLNKVCTAINEADFN